jgi:hypothetical protein
MRREDFQAWYDEIQGRGRSVPKERDAFGIARFKEGAARAWATEAEAALASVFPDGHSVRQAWNRAIENPNARSITNVFDSLFGVFEGAANLIRNDRLGSLIDTIRNESESDLLDQAVVLLMGDHRAAATVIAGGALDSHLKHYLGRHSVTFTGDGSISKYNSAVGQARKANPNLYNVNDGKLVEGWGGIRNEAAHDPGSFSRSKEEVQRLIDGIREFIGRTA